MPSRIPSGGSSSLFKGEMQFSVVRWGFAECYRGHWPVRQAAGIDGFIAEMDTFRS